MMWLSMWRQPPLGHISDIWVLWKNTILFLSGNTDPLQAHLQSELLILWGDYRRVTSFWIWQMLLVQRRLQYLLFACWFLCNKVLCGSRTLKKKKKQPALRQQHNLLSRISLFHIKCTKQTQYLPRTAFHLCHKASDCSVIIHLQPHLIFSIIRVPNSRGGAS